jgi:hypothetical protein
MATHSKPSDSTSVHAFPSLFANAQRKVTTLAGNVREVQLELEGPPLRARSRSLTSSNSLFVHGENYAREDMLLRHEAEAPLVAVHVALSGGAIQQPDGMAQPITTRPGFIQLFSAPNSNTTVRLRAHERNEVFRINMSAPFILGLAARHPELGSFASRVANGAPFCTLPVKPFALARLYEEAAQVMDSHHYGAFRPLFLEARALTWLAMALACERGSELGTARAVPPGEAERMHAARDLLLGRISDPPTLAEVARAIGSNEF